VSPEIVACIPLRSTCGSKKQAREQNVAYYRNTHIHSLTQYINKKRYAQGDAENKARSRRVSIPHVETKISKGLHSKKDDSRKKTSELKRRDVNQGGQSWVTDALWVQSSGGHTILARFDSPDDRAWHFPSREVRWVCFGGSS